MNLTNASRKFLHAYHRWIRHHYASKTIRKKYNLQSDDLLNKDAQYFLAIVAIFKNEDPYLLEWIEFHRLMGVDHFFLYDNDLEKSSTNLLSPYEKIGIVTRIPFPNLPGLKDSHNKLYTLNIQQLAYGDCLLRFRQHYQYLIMLDLDEFIYPVSNKHDSVVAALNELKSDDIKGIEVNWTNFGSSGHVKKPSGLVIENYLKRIGQIEHRGTAMVKSIGNTKYISRRYSYSNVHQFIYRFSVIDIFKKFIWGKPRVLRHGEANALFKLNHYKFKSFEEYQRRALINGGWLEGTKTEENFRELDPILNQVEDRDILRFLPKLKSRLKAL
ncbi:MAG: glycosyltransferase family 92 protein [Candidatus Neomarinimicrobiota bacterium]